MPPNFEPSSAVEAYRAIIDQLVEETTPGVSERLLHESGIYSKASDDAAGNELVRSLTAEQRDLLADLLHRERLEAIFDTLAVLTW